MPGAPDGLTPFGAPVGAPVGAPLGRTRFAPRCGTVKPLFAKQLLSASVKFANAPPKPPPRAPPAPGDGTPLGFAAVGFAAVGFAGLALDLADGFALAFALTFGFALGDAANVDAVTEENAKTRAMVKTRESLDLVLRIWVESGLEFKFICLIWRQTL
jgi:hypothetical protein